MNGGMSAIGTKRTWTTALHMSAFGGKADIREFASHQAQVASQSIPVLLCPIITNPSRCPARSREIAAAPLLARRRDGVLLWRGQRVIRINRVRTHQVRGQQHTLLQAHHQTAAHCIGGVVMPANRVSNPLAARGDDGTFQLAQLINQRGVVQKANAAAIN